MVRLSLAIFLLFTAPVLAEYKPPDYGGPCCTQGQGTRWVRLSDSSVFMVVADSDRLAWDVVETHLWEAGSILSILEIWS
jgi:hypothetical protein